MNRATFDVYNQYFVVIILKVSGKICGNPNALREFERVLAAFVPTFRKEGFRAVYGQ